MRSRSQSGFLLLEAMLAMGVFALAALSLVTALQDTALAANEARTAQEVVDRLQSVLDEVAKAPQLVPGTSEIPEDSLGLRYSVETVMVEDLFNKDGVPLSNFYRVTVSAWDAETLPGDAPDHVAETYRYALLYQN